MPEHSHYLSTSESYLNLLKQKLAKLTGASTVEEYHALISFYSSFVPSLMKAERCSVFIMDLGSKEICSIFGTGLKNRPIKPPLRGSIVGGVISSGKGTFVNNLRDHVGYHSLVEEQTGFVCQNILCAPIKSVTGNSVTGAVQLLNKVDGQLFTEEDLSRLEEIAHFLSLSIESIVLRQEILRIATSLGKEAERLERESVNGVTLIAESPAMRKVLDLVRIVSKTPVNVLIQGENGTGKELVARMIHQFGDRQNKGFFPVNCASIPENLMESQFFGHEKGAFTGADSARKGLFEEACGGILFLDEIGEMPLVIQPKVLRAIQEGEGQRVGSNVSIKYDFRLISATNRDLSEEVAQKRFREDLFFRIFSVEITLPPLRDRREDILPLSLHFLKITNERFGKAIPGFSPEILNVFEAYGWPGNVRQLQKEVERLVALTDDGQLIQPDQLSRDLHTLYLRERHNTHESEDGYLALLEQTQQLEIILIQKAMRRSKGNKTKAAKLLAITRQGLDKKIKRYDLSF
jgi:transcriptional regulator with GAF, ATPase, and Fis domain